MFDVVRGRLSAPSRLKPAVVVSVLAHVVLLAGAILLSHPPPPPPAEPKVPWHTIRASVRGGNGAPAAPTATSPRSVGRRPPRTVRTPLEIARPVDLPPRTAPELEGDDPGSNRLEGNGPGGSGDGRECAVPPCGGGGDLVSEDVVAEVPVLLSAPEVILSPDARRSGVEGTMLVRCVITAAGTVEGCEVLRSLPPAEAAVLAALRGRQYRPAEIAGRPVSMRQVFTIKVRQTR